MLNGSQRATFFFSGGLIKSGSTNFSRHASFVNGVLPLNLQRSCNFKAFLVCRSQPLVFVINCSAVKRPISPAIPLSARRKPGCINENKTKTAKRLDLLKCSTAYLDECSENRTTWLVAPYSKTYLPRLQSCQVGNTNTIGGVPSARGIVAILGTLLIFKYI